MRLDKFLKVSRIIKRRTTAKEACDIGRVLINGREAKASHDVKPGDVLQLRLGERSFFAEVLLLKKLKPRKLIMFLFGGQFLFCHIGQKYLFFITKML